MKIIRTTSSFIQKMLSRKKAWSLCNKLFIRSLLDNINYPKGDMGEDMVITFQCLLNANTISYLPSSFYYYFQNLLSITHTPSEEKKMKNFYQNKENLDLLITIFKEKGLFQQYEKEFISLKYVVKMMLLNTSFDKEKRLIWRNTYPEIKKEILFNQYIRNKDKLKFILTNIGIYSFRYLFRNIIDKM